MEKKQISPDHYSVFLPCQFTNNVENMQCRCTLALEISKTSVKFNLFIEGSKSPAPIEFDYKQYNVFLVSSLLCTFTSLKSGISTTFYFFQGTYDGQSNNNFRRFIFSLADAGMLTYDPNDSLTEIYNNQIVFRFIPEHSFVPDGLYSYVYTIIYRNVRAICLSRIKSIMKGEDTPYNPKYIELIIPSVRSLEMQRITASIQNKRAKYQSNFDFLHHIKILQKVLEKSNDDDIYQIFKAELKTVSNKHFRDIESDCQKFNELIKDKKKSKSCYYLSQIDKSKWNDKLSDICMNVCKVHILSENKSYYTNGFLVAMRVALFLKNGEKLDTLADLSSKSKYDEDINTFTQKIDSIVGNKSDDEFEIIVFFIYKAIMEGLTPDIAHYFAYDFSMNAYEFFSPSSKAYFVFKKIRTFSWMENDVNEILQSTLRNPWVAWFYIMKTNNPEKALQSLIASIIFHSVPQLINQKIEGEQSISDFWPNFRRCLQNDINMIKSIMDVATYIYDGSAFQNSF